jgi:hypothetical protein
MSDQHSCEGKALFWDDFSDPQAAVQFLICRGRAPLRNLRYRICGKGGNVMITNNGFAVLDKFGFEVPPVALKFQPKRSERIPRLDEKMTFCHMLKKAQDGNAFYADDENHSCDAGLYVLGRDVPEFFTNGEFGAGLRIYEEPRAASRLYQLPSSSKLAIWKPSTVIAQETLFSCVRALFFFQKTSKY